MMATTIQAHNERPAAVWSSGGEDYDEISRGIADAILEGRNTAASDVVKAVSEGSDEFVEVSEGAGA